MKLHDYQETAVAFLRGRDRAGLFLDMGLGKTLSCLAALEPRHFPVAIVAPKKVAETVWAAEVDKWGFDYDIATAIGTPAERRAVIEANHDITVISRDNEHDLLSTRHRAYRTLIIDELSGYKGRGQRWKEIKELIRADAIPYVWGLTGTPSPNGYLDLWPQIALLDNGQRLGKNITGFRNRYFIAGRQLPNGVIVEWIMRPEGKEAIDAAIEDMCLSMKSEGRIHLPPTTLNVVPVELPPRVRTAYRDLKKNLLTDVRDVLGGLVHTATGAAQLANRLSQITAGFLYEDVDDWAERQAAILHNKKASSWGVNAHNRMDVAERGKQKVTRLHNAKTEVVEGMADVATSPLLVFYRYKPELAALQRAFPKARTIAERGVVEAWNAGDVPMLLAHPASAGHGLNLQDGGHTIVWTTLPNLDLEQWEQSNKRLSRQGQKNPVVIHVLEAADTVDHLILEGLHGKADVQGSLMNHLESPL